MEQISLASAEVTNTWPLNLSNIGGRVNSVRAMHLVEEESILHLAFSTGLYCRLDLRGQEEPATRTVLSLNSAEAGGEAASWHAQFGQPEGAGSLLLFAISSQGKSKNFAIGSTSSKSSQILLFLLKKKVFV